MKRFQLNFQRHVLRLTIGVLTLANVAVFVWSCTKDDSMQEETTGITEPRLNPIDETQPDEYIAFVNPIEGVFYADPEYLPNVLEQLDATPIGTAGFLLRGTAFSGSQVEFSVQLKLLPAPAIADIAIAEIKVLQTNPDVILEGTDPNTGVPIRVRRNWKCGNTLAAVVTNCQNYDNGKSEHTKFFEVSICRKEDGGLCPEEFGIWGMKYTYSTKNCTGAPVNAEPQRYWVCK